MNHDWLRERALRPPDREALIEATQSWSFGELDACSQRIAHGLRQAGVGGGDRVALLAGNEGRPSRRFTRCHVPARRWSG